MSPCIPSLLGSHTLIKNMMKCLTVPTSFAFFKSGFVTSFEVGLIVKCVIQCINNEFHQTMRKIVHDTFPMVTCGFDIQPEAPRTTLEQKSIYMSVPQMLHLISDEGRGLVLFELISEK